MPRLGQHKPITEGSINWNNGSYAWGYSMNGVRRTKTMKTRDKIEKYRHNKLIEVRGFGLRSSFSP